MPVYRRNRVPGGTFFFTVNLLDRRSDLLVTQIHMLRDALRQVRLHASFRIDAWVVLPDQMRCLWTLPAGDAEFPGRWRDQDAILEGGWARIETKGCTTTLRPSRRALWALLRMSIRL